MLQRYINICQDKNEKMGMHSQFRTDFWEWIPKTMGDSFTHVFSNISITQDR